jgi:hypothetical protein
MLRDVSSRPLDRRQFQAGDAEHAVRDDAEAIGNPCLPVLDVDAGSDT